MVYSDSEEATWAGMRDRWEVQSWRDPSARTPTRINHLSEVHGLGPHMHPTITDAEQMARHTWCRNQRALYRQFYVVGRRGRGESLWTLHEDGRGVKSWAALMRDDGSISVKIEDACIRKFLADPGQDFDGIRSIFMTRRLHPFAGILHQEFSQASQWMRDYDNRVNYDHFRPDSEQANEESPDDSGSEHPSDPHDPTDSLSEGEVDEWEQAPEDTGFYHNIREPHPRLGAAVAALKIEEVRTLRRSVPSDRMCVICVEDYELGDVCYVLPCGHRFHLLCMSPLWQEKPDGDCPMCRKSIIPEDEL
ncbi:MAG: hypothetical protein M1822_008507 [Bathelium mastoideum]|nr:MAG: hypothetical protein M1822_008507 [Bathelium mastoideum]